MCGRISSLLHDRFKIVSHKIIISNHLRNIQNDVWFMWSCRWTSTGCVAVSIGPTYNGRVTIHGLGYITLDGWLAVIALGETMLLFLTSIKWEFFSPLPALVYVRTLFAVVFDLLILLNDYCYYCLEI